MNFIPNTDADRAVMLKRIGLDSLDDLFADIPAALRSPRLDLPSALSEAELLRVAGEIAGRNANTMDFACFLGAGAYNHFIPSVVHHITGRSEFYTAYTPYQAEISQGTLQTIFEYQSVVCELTGMDVANASMYDGASAAAEAAILALSATRRKKIVASPTMNPDYRSVLMTYTSELDATVVVDWTNDEWPAAGKVDARHAARLVDNDTACLIVQQPNFLGSLEDVEELATIAHNAGALFIAVVDPISLGLLKPPGSYGADVVVGEGQSFGNPVGFGGPYVGLFAAKEKYLRQMPGRIIGQTTDHDGRRGYVLTLQTREQHIRREKATSNICSNEALVALSALVYSSVMGRQGLRRVAELCVQKSHYAAEKIAKLPGYSLPFSVPFFDEFVVRCPEPPAQLNARLLQHKIIGGYDLGKADSRLADCMLLCVTESNTKDEIDRLIDVLGRQDL